MTSIAVVASAHDAKFAEEVRAALRGAGLDSAVSPALPQAAETYVILIWGADLEAAHSIDAQALIGLWSEERLLVARRDATPLPLGLRDLPSLSPASTAAEVCAAVPSARYATASPHQPSAKTSMGLIVAALLAIGLMGGGAWYYFNKGNLEKQAALTASLEGATKATEDLKQAHLAELEALKALEQARAAEEAARKSVDIAKLKEAQDAAKRAETEAAKQAEFVKQREAAAADARKKSLDSSATLAKRAATKAPEPQKAAVAAAAPDAETPKAEAPKAEMTTAEAPESAAVKSARSTSRSERERAMDEEAAQRALSAAATARAPGTTSENEMLYQQALALERGDSAKDAIRLYRRAARAGSGKAALRLGEIYDKGLAGVSRDYAESLQWYEVARKAGENVPPRRERDDPGAPVVVAPAPAPAPKSVAPASVIPEAAKSEPAKAAVKSAPATREPAKPVPVPAVKPAPASEPVKAEAPPPPASAPALDPAKTTPQLLPPETKTEWFTIRGLLIALFVLALIAWRRSRRRKKAEARREQRESGAATNVPVLSGKADSRTVYKPGPVAPQGDATLFVSYSHKDRSRVEPIVSVIEAMGRRVWMDRSDITGQTGWAGQIVRAIRECRAVVLMASPNSYTSDQVVRELYLAMNHKKTIVPIEIEPAELPDELQYILAPFQHHRLSGRETREVVGRALAAV